MGGTFKGERSEGNWQFFKETMQTTHRQAIPIGNVGGTRLAPSPRSSLTSGSRKKVYRKWELGQITKDGYKSSISVWGNIRKAKAQIEMEIASIIRRKKKRLQQQENEQGSVGPAPVKKEGS